MGNRVEGCRKVQEDEDTDVAGVSCKEEVVGDFNEGGLCAVVSSEAGLKRLIELMVGHMLMKLGGHCSFQDFTKERKVGDRAVIVELVGVETGLLEDGCDGGCFEAGGDETRF